MQSVKKRGNKIIILLLLSVFVIGIIGIGIYPFDNRSLQMKIVTTKGTYVQEIGSEDIAGGTCQLVELTGIEDAKIKKSEILWRNEINSFKRSTLRRIYKLY